MYDPYGSLGHWVARAVTHPSTHAACACAPCRQGRQVALHTHSARQSIKPLFLCRTLTLTPTPNPTPPPPPQTPKCAAAVNHPPLISFVSALLRGSASEGRRSPLAGSESVGGVHTGTGRSKVLYLAAILRSEETQVCYLAAVGAQGCGACAVLYGRNHECNNTLARLLCFGCSATTRCSQQSWSCR